MTSPGVLKVITFQDVKEKLLTQASYHQLKPYRAQIEHNDLQSLNVIVAAVKDILATQSSLPLQKLLSLRLCKDLIDTHNDNAVMMIQEELMKIFFEIAIFDYSNADPDKGKFLLSPQPDKEQQVIGNSMWRLATECIYVWSIWYPTMSQFDEDPSIFLQMKQELDAFGVEFPKLNFFKIEDVKNLYIQRTEKNSYSERPLLEEFDLWVKKNEQVKQDMVEFKNLTTEKGKFQEKIDSISKYWRDFLKRSEDILVKLIKESSLRNVEDQIEEKIDILCYWIDYAQYFTRQYILFTHKELSFIKFKKLWAKFDETPDGNIDLSNIPHKEEQVDFKSQFSDLFSEKERSPNPNSINSLPKYFFDFSQNKFSDSRQKIPLLSVQEGVQNGEEDNDQQFNKLLNEKDNQIAKLKRDKKLLLNQIESQKYLIIELQQTVKQLSSKLLEQDILEQSNSQSNVHSIKKQQQGLKLQQIVLSDE